MKEYLVIDEVWVDAATVQERLDNLNAEGWEVRAYQVYILDGDFYWHALLERPIGRHID